MSYGTSWLTHAYTTFNNRMSIMLAQLRTSYYKVTLFSINHTYVDSSISELRWWPDFCMYPLVSLIVTSTSIVIVEPMHVNLYAEGADAYWNPLDILCWHWSSATTYYVSLNYFLFRFSVLGIISYIHWYLIPTGKFFLQSIKYVTFK